MNQIVTYQYENPESAKLSSLSHHASVMKGLIVSSKILTEMTSILYELRQ